MGNKLKDILLFLLYISILCIFLFIYFCCGVLVAFVLGITTYSIVWYATLIIWPFPVLFVIWFCLAMFGLTIAAFLRSKLRN